MIRRSLLVMAGVVLLSGAGAGFGGSRLSAQDTAVVPRFLNDTNSLSVRFPTSKINRLGWTMRIRFSSVRTADTMRVELDFATTGGPTTADLNFDVRLIPIDSGHTPPQSSLRITLPVRIAEGTRQIRFARHVPKSSFGNFYRVQILEEGRQVPGCELNVGNPIMYRESAIYENQAEQQRWRAMWIESDADEATRVASIRMYALMFAGLPFYIGKTPSQWEEQIKSGVSDTGQIHFPSVGLDELPHDWRGLRSFDTILIHRNEWLKLADSDAADAVAIRQWVRAGGTVIVRDADPKRDDTATVASYRSPSVDFVNQTVRATETTLARYQQFANRDGGMFASEIGFHEITPEEVEAWRSWFPDVAEELRESLQEYSFVDVRSDAGVQAREEFGGFVVFLGRQDGRPIQILQWAAAAELLSWRRSRLIRSGVDPILGSQRFFQWVIPGVSQPPVYTFMGLLGVFVILVGPVAYRKTAKAGRSYLMFAIAPILAITTTAAMLGYGVIADGFGTRVRSRQITWVDGKSGDAFTRTRSTYFAGIRPSDGLVFPPDSEVTLYPDNEGRSWESRIDERFGSRGEVRVSDEWIRFGRDFLPSRQQRQFVVQRPVNSWGRIRLEPDPQAKILEKPKMDEAITMIPGMVSRPSGDSEPLVGPETVLIQSETETALSELIVCDSSGRYYYLETLSAKATRQAMQITRKEASQRMGEMYKRQWLISTVTERRENNRSANSGEVTDVIVDQLAGVDSPTKPNEGVFEFELQQRLQLQSDLPDNSFLGLAELTPESVAIDGTDVSASIHFVMGSLP